MKKQYDIRCPVCLNPMQVARNIPVYKELQCEKCQNIFEFQNALPALKKEPPPPPDNTSVIEQHNTNVKSFLSWSIVIIPAIFFFSATYTNSLNGPSFLVFMFVLFCGTLLASFFVRSFLFDVMTVRIMALLTFEGVCVYRLLWGYSHGMRNFAIMLVFMVIGAFFYFPLPLDRYTGRSSGCSGGCGSSCGGGCGGGCGGCGG